MENESRPSAAIDQNTLQFSDIKYLVPSTQTITITNTGKVLAKFRFIPKLDEIGICKPWLRITPCDGLILPGEKMDVQFTVLVDNRTASSLNKGKEKIEDILILHLDGGIDYFVSSHVCSPAFLD